jgi:hypothetical protein
MKLPIERGTSVKDVKHVFTNYYPYLKIEFYKMLADGEQNKTKREALPLNFILGNLLKNADKILLDLDKDISVSALETQFSNIRLDAEVFRRSGNVWVETSLTDNWTLQQQNEEAEEISKHFNEKKNSPSNWF